MWLLGLMSVAYGTWSTIGVDPDAGQMGGAGTSCVGSLNVNVIYASVPDVGVVHAQAQLSTAMRDRAQQAMAEDLSPDEIIALVTDPEVDSGFSRRQYGVVDLLGRSAGFTGSNNGDWAGDRQGEIDTISYSVQGNILTSQNTVGQAEAGFLQDDACDLAERLMLSLERGGDNGEGDSRCTPFGVPSDSAFIRVEGTAGALILDLSVVDSSTPMEDLRAQFEDWREDNPCPEPPEEPEEPEEPEDSDDVEDTDDIDVQSDCGCASTTAPTWSVSLLIGLLAWGRQRRFSRQLQSRSCEVGSLGR